MVKVNFLGKSNCLPQTTLKFKCFVLDLSCSGNRQSWEQLLDILRMCIYCKCMQQAAKITYHFVCDQINGQVSTMVNVMVVFRNLVYRNWFGVGVSNQKAWRVLGLQCNSQNVLYIQFYKGRVLDRIEYRQTHFSISRSASLQLKISCCNTDKQL